MPHLSRTPRRQGGSGTRQGPRYGFLANGPITSLNHCAISYHARFEFCSQGTAKTTNMGVARFRDAQLLPERRKRVDGFYGVLKGRAYSIATIATSRSNTDARSAGFKDVYDLLMSDSDHPRQAAFLTLLTDDVMPEEHRRRDSAICWDALIRLSFHIAQPAFEAGVFFRHATKQYLAMLAMPILRLGPLPSEALTVPTQRGDADVCGWFGVLGVPWLRTYRLSHGVRAIGNTAYSHGERLGISTPAPAPEPPSPPGSGHRSDCRFSSQALGFRP
jgi:hypothetical protein